MGHYYPQNSPLNIGQSGENRSWSIENVPFNSQDTRDFLAPQQTPFGSNFPTATHCIRVQAQLTDDYSYFVLTPNQFTEIGYGSDYETPVFSPLNPQKVVYPLSLGYGHPSWTSVSQSVLDMGGGFVYTYRDSTIHVVDGWGTLTTDFGTHDVLRVFSYHWERETLEGEPQFLVEYYRYDWVDINGIVVASMQSVGDDQTFSRGTVAVNEITQLIGVGNTPVVVTGFALGQNYPNPFNSSTAISFNVPSISSVKIVVFDMLGREVTTLVDDVRSAGSYNIYWDGKITSGLSVASGVYVYQIKAGNFQDAKKMVLLR